MIKAGRRTTHTHYAKRARRLASVSLLSLAAFAIAPILSAHLAPSLQLGQAHAAPLDAALFGQRAQVYDAAISPDGRQIAMIQTFEGEYIISVVDLQNRDDQPRAMSLDPAMQPKYVKWANDGLLMLSVRQTVELNREPVDGSFLYSIETDAMKSRPVVKVKAGFRQFNDRVLDWLEDDPDHIIMEFSDDGKDQTEPAIWKVKVPGGRRSKIRRSSANVNHWVTDAEGVPRIGIGRVSRGREALMRILNPQTDQWEDASNFPGIDPETMSIIAVTDSGKSVVVSAYRGKDTRGLHRYSLEEKRFTETIYQNERYDVGDVILSKDGNDIVGARFVGESEERVLFDAYDSTFEEALAKFDGFQVDFIDQTATSDTLVLRISAPSTPGQMILFDRGGNVRRIGADMPGLKSKDMGEVISVRYSARDGQKIPAFITVPPTITEGGLPKMPFIVLPHGGPFARDEKRFDYLAQFFASRGYGVLQMNFRGSEGYGKSFSDAGRDRWVTMQEDVEDGMRWLVEKGYADEEKSCIAGWSYGGYAALMGVSKDPELYNCAIAIAALTDIPDAISDLKSYVNGKAMAERTFGDFMDDKDLMRANNPVDLADRIKVPVFMAHGTMDTSVEHDQFRKMKRRLEKAGVDGTYLSFDGEDHYMSKQANRQEMLTAIDKFLRKNNGVSPYAP